jgi:primosomal protein N''
MKMFETVYHQRSGWNRRRFRQTCSKNPLVRITDGQPHHDSARADLHQHTDFEKLLANCLALRSLHLDRSSSISPRVK